MILLGCENTLITHMERLARLRQVFTVKLATKREAEGGVSVLYFHRSSKIVTFWGVASRGIQMMLL